MPSPITNRAPHAGEAAGRAARARPARAPRRSTWRARLLGAAWLATTAAPAVVGAEVLHLESSRALPGQASTTPPWPPGTRLTWDERGLRGPSALACAPGRQTLLAIPPQGLFQGAFEALGPSGAQQAATALGWSAPRIPTVRLDCPNASLDLHRQGGAHWLIALDGQVLRWRAAGGPTDPQATVRALLLAHLEHPASLDAGRVKSLAPWLSASLRDRLDRWLSATHSAGEPPALNGDPFTDTQEPPGSLGLGRALRHGASARVPVTVHADPAQAREIQYHLKHDGRRWRVDDITYRPDVRLRCLLAERASCRQGSDR